MHDGRHVCDNEYAETETPARNPEIGFGFLIARCHEAEDDDDHEVKGEDRNAESVWTQIGCLQFLLVCATVEPQRRRT